MKKREENVWRFGINCMKSLQHSRNNNETIRAKFKENVEPPNGNSF